MCIQLKWDIPYVIQHSKSILSFSETFLWWLQFEQADEATRNRKVMEIEKEDTDELQQKYQVSCFLNKAFANLTCQHTIASHED